MHTLQIAFTPRAQAVTGDSPQFARAMSRILKSLQRRFPEGVPLHGYLAPLAQASAVSHAADANFVREFESGDDGQFWSRAWEAILFGRFATLGWNAAVAAPGPDFRLTTPIGEILVEATVPAPDGLPKEWLEDHNGVYSMPHEAMLLRWTSSISTKRDKQGRQHGSENLQPQIFFVAEAIGLTCPVSSDRV